MIAVIYDRESGAIVQSVVGAEDQIAATASRMGRAWLAVDLPPGGMGEVDALDTTHRVVGSALVPTEGRA